MDGRVFCMIFGIFLFIVITWMIFSGGDDDDVDAPKSIVVPKENICKQIEERFNEQYLVENNLNHLRLNDDYTSDIELIAQNSTVRAHKIILASHSQYFNKPIGINNTAVSSGRNASTIQQLRIEFIEHKTLIIVLNFMYSGQLSDDLFQNPNDYENLLRAATEFQMDSLKCEISKRLNARINIHNVGSIVALAAETNTRFLMIVAANFLLDRFQQVKQTTEWQSVIKVHKDILANAIDFHANLPENSDCDIQCVASTLKSPAVFTRLRQFFLTQSFADAEIYVTANANGGGDSKVFHVNRAILIGQSASFQRAFGDTQRIELHGIKIDEMEEFLVYMYSGWPTQKMKKMPAGLLQLSAIYGMKGLQTACEDILINDLNIKNAAEIIVVADNANSKRLFTIALDFILKNRRFVVKTNAWIDLKQNHPEILTKLQ